MPINISSFLENRTNKKFFLLTFLWIGFIILAIVLRTIMLPFLLAALLAFILNPIISKINKIKFQKKNIPRWIAIIVVYLIIIAIIAIIATFFLPELYREIINLTKDTTIAINHIDETSIYNYVQKIDNFFIKYNIPIKFIDPDLNKTSNIIHLKDNTISIDLIKISKKLLFEFIGYMQNEFSGIIFQLQNIVTRIINFFIQFILVFMITGFLLADTKQIYNFLLNLNPKGNHYPFKEFLSRVDSGLSGVVRGQLIICIVNAALTLTGLLLLNVKFTFLLATLAGVFSLIPVFGSIISTIPIFLVAITSSVYTGFFALIWVSAIHALEANLLNPKIMGDSAKIHPALIILALLTGKHYYGIVGALLAVPITSIILTIFYSMIIKAKSLDK